MELITASRLESLSIEKSRLFQELLPELVKRLIIDSSKSLSSIRIPSKDDIWAPGFDGIIESDEKSNYISSGKSVWEFGTNKDSLKKINSDYDKRTEDSLGIDKKGTSFYFVIPKVWAFNNTDCSITEWENSKQDWKEVHLYDATVLCDWINSRPVVAAWLFEQLFDDNKLNFKTIATAWDSFSKTTNPAFTEKMFLLQRDNEKEIFLDSIAENEIIKIKSKTFIDAYGFCLSSILNSSDLLNEIIVVYDEQTYKALNNIVDGKTFLLAFMEISEFDERNKTIICYSQEAISITDVDVELTPLRRNQFNEALKDMGINECEIEDFYFHTHGEILALIRKIPGLSNAIKPRWALNDNIKCLVPLMFMRTINISNEAQKEICEILADDSFDNILNVFDEFIKMEDSPIKRVENIYSIASYEETWNALQLNINGSEFKRLTELILHIIDICTENIPNDLKYNYHVEDLLNILSFNYIYYSYSYPNNTILNTAVNAIIDNIWICDELWNSLSIFSEVNPIVLLNIFEKDINSSNSKILSAFQNGDYNSKYWLILSAIQKLTLYPETKINACKMLFDLCKIESKYIYNGNTPEESLLSVLCLWITDGELSIKNKKDLILYFIELDNNYGISLSIKLLQVNCVSTTRTVGSKYKTKRNSVSTEEYRSALLEITTKIIDTVIKNKNVHFLPTIVDAYSYFPPFLIEKLLIACSDFELDTTSKIQIGHDVREIIYNTKLYKKTKYDEYIKIFVSHLNDIEKDLFDDQLYVFYDNYYYCPIIDAPYLGEEKTTYTEQSEYFFEYRLSVLNYLFEKNAKYYLPIIIDIMEDITNWGFLLAKSNYSSFALELSECAISKNKFKIVSGFIDGLDLKTAKQLLEFPEEAMKAIVSDINRQDILPFIDNKEWHNIFWSKKTMFEYTPFVFEQLIKFNPNGLLPYYSYYCKDTANEIDNILQVLKALIDAKCEVNNDLLNALIRKIDEVEYYSDEYAELCMRLSALYSHHSEFHNYLKEYYYRNPDKLYELMLDEKKYWDIVSYFQLPAKALDMIENMNTFFVAIFENSKDENKHKAYGLIGALLGDILKATPIDTFIERKYPSLIEKYYSDDFESNFIRRYVGFAGFRWIGDVSDQRQKGDEINNVIGDIEIQYPHTTHILRKIVRYYYINAKSDYMKSETDKL